METINNQVLKDENIYPDSTVLQSVLGQSYEYYLELLKLYETNNLQCNWRYYHDGKAWLCKVQLKKKTVSWMSAWPGFMQVTIYLPERLLEDVINLDIDNQFKERFKSVKRVGKSVPCIFEVINKSELINFEKLMIFKMAAT